MCEHPHLEPDGRAGAVLLTPLSPALNSTEKKGGRGCSPLTANWGSPFILQLFTCWPASFPQGMARAPSTRPVADVAQAAASFFALCLFRPGKGRPDLQKGHS